MSVYDEMESKNVYIASLELVCQNLKKELAQKNEALKRATDLISNHEDDIQKMDGVINFWKNRAENNVIGAANAISDYADKLLSEKQMHTNWELEKQNLTSYASSIYDEP